jgi:apolipoprotein N-acyltransferase
MTRRDLLLCATSGLLAAAAFPPFSIWPLAWVAWVPLLLALRGRSPRAAFLPGFTSGLVAWVATLPWIVIVVHVYGHAPLAFAVLVLFALSAYLALYPAVWAVGVACAARAGAGACVWLGAGLWVALEFLRTYLLSGFPWAILANSQAGVVPIIQIAEWTGAYGVSFLLILASLSIAGVLAAMVEGKRVQEAWFRLGVVALFVAVVFSYGQGRRDAIATRMKARHPLTVALIQGNIPQDVKWDAAFVLGSLQRYLALTAEATKKKPDLIVWPEAATTFFFQDEPRLAARIFKAADAARAPIFFGGSAYRVEAEGGRRRARYFNSAYLVAPGGRLLGRYDKIHLVPFGEYVPFRRYLPFLPRVATGIAGEDFTPGDGQELLRVGGRKLGALICYEAIFPALSRRLERRGAQLLINITNDAWFGRSGAPGQHLEAAVFRAVEGRIGIARAANTGISALIQPTGEVTLRTALFKIVEVTGPLTPRVLTTFYTRHGDVFAWACVGLGVLAFVAGRLHN